METLDDQFDHAVERVSITDEKARHVVAAHTEVRQILEADDQLRQWGIDTILIGSYARQTSRYPAKDADVFLRFTKLTVEDDPALVYGAVAAVLIRHYGAVENGGRVTRQPRSLKIDFPAEGSRHDLSFSVDAVPAVKWAKDWGIPNRRPELWTDSNSRWIRTNPVEFTDLTVDLSTKTSSPTVGSRNAYRPVVRMLRQVRHAHLGEERPGGLYVEVLAFEAWQSESVSGDSWAVLLTRSLRDVATRMRTAATEGITDPVLKTKMSPALTGDQWNRAAQIFEGLARSAETALDESKCRAAQIWRQILGTNDRGEVFPLPPGCGPDGKPITGVAAVASTGSSESRGFA